MTPRGEKVRCGVFEKGEGLIQSYRTAVYIRLSREDGDKEESDSIVNQRKLLLDYVNRHEELELAGSYEDDGWTGTNFTRPGFQRMIDDIEIGRVNCVIVKDLSRFGRDYIDTGRYLERYFPERGVRFISVSDQIDSQKQAYDILLPIKNIFNEQYARDISQKVQSAFKAKQKAGEFIGAFPSYGYQKSAGDKHRLTADPYAAEVVRFIFSSYLSGMGKQGIAKILNERKILCPSAYKQLHGQNYRNNHRLSQTSYWTYSTINKILHNEIYTGTMVQGKTFRRMKGKAQRQAEEDWVTVPETHEPIIERQVWELTQEMMKKKTRILSLQSNQHVFAGILKCGECGRSLVRKREKDGDVYQCGTYVRAGRGLCTPHRIPRFILEKLILEDILLMAGGQEKLSGLWERAFSERERKEVEKTEKRLDGLSDEILRLKRLGCRLYEDYGGGIITMEEYQVYRKEFQERQEKLEMEADCLRAGIRNHCGTGMNQTAETNGRLESLSRELSTELIDHITIYEGNRIRICYRFSQGEAWPFREKISTIDENIKRKGETR